jgi:hypothetical protein
MDELLKEINKAVHDAGGAIDGTDNNTAHHPKIKIKTFAEGKVKQNN